MCASYQARLNVTRLVELFDRAGVPLGFPGGRPNIEPVDEVRPTDASLAVRAADAGDGAAVLVPMRFGWPAPASADGKKRPPVINVRSEGRRIVNGPAGGRALVPVSGFYEFTGAKYPKTRWRLEAADGDPLLLAAVWRDGSDGGGIGGGAFALLTGEPGPDIAPYHSRGVIPLPPAVWADWLSGRAPDEAVLAPAPAGTLVARPAPRPTPPAG